MPGRNGGNSVSRTPAVILRNTPSAGSPPTEYPDQAGRRSRNGPHRSSAYSFSIEAAAFRLIGRNRHDRGEYPEALDYFQKAYSLFNDWDSGHLEAAVTARS